MTEKQPIALVISDIDNTIADKFNVWGNALDSALDKLAKLHKRDRKDIEQDLLAHVPESVKHISGPYIGKDLRSDVACTPSLKPSSPEMEKEQEKICMPAFCPPSTKSKHRGRSLFFTPIPANPFVFRVWRKWALRRI